MGRKKADRDFMTGRQGGNTSAPGSTELEDSCQQLVLSARCSLPRGASGPCRFLRLEGICYDAAHGQTSVGLGRDRHLPSMQGWGGGWGWGGGGGGCRAQVAVDE